jgi:hypothetical protein
MGTGQQRRRRVLRGRSWSAALATVALAVALGLWARPAAAKPGIVINLQGQTFSGDLSEDDNFVYVSAPGGQLRIDKRNVAKIDYNADVDAQYAEQHAKLAGDDVKGRIELAHWANQHGRPDLAVDALEEARVIDPANRDVALTLDAVQRQMDLDRRQGKLLHPTPPKPAVKPVVTTGPATTAPAGPPPMERRLLTMAEVNAVRQVEMRSDDRLVKVRFDNNVARRYLLASGFDPKRFGGLTGEEQALEILKYGTPDMAKDVKILTDPTPLQLFKTKVMPVVALGCGSTACHGGTHGGDFGLYTGEGTQALYTNFYILQTYAKQIGGVKYLAMDREVPDRSLVLQFGLPVLQGRPPHPPVPEFRPRFKGRDDTAYVTVDDWLTYSLRVIQPDYGFNVSPRLLPSTQPAAVPTDAVPAPAPPTTTRPTVHGTPLPRTASGAVTQPSP